MIRAKPVSFPAPPRLVDLKHEIVSADPETQERLTRAWNDLLIHLSQATREFKETGSDIVPQVDFSELDKLQPENVEHLKRRGCVLVRNVVDDDEATSWKKDLEDFIKANPDVDGSFPEGDKQFFQLYWTRSQIRARSHPNVLATIAWLNNLYHLNSGQKLEGVDLSTPLTYADRFRIRRPGVQWDMHPPHIDGGAIERWENPDFRRCYSEILKGNWKQHDPYDLEGRLNAKTSLYGKPNQASVFRTFQGWLAMSETAPTEGTLKVFPDVILSNAYVILRPFFRQKATPVSADPLDAENWEFDISTPEFPGIIALQHGFRGPRLTQAWHPHLNLEDSMTSVPKVNPGDMVFWHCDVIHSVEIEHTGKADSAVMYIPAVPLTPQNASYIVKQKQSFLEGLPPPDFPQGKTEGQFPGRGRPEDIVNSDGRKAMGLPIEVA